MAVAHIDIGDAALWICSYNDRDPKTLLYCQWLVGRVKELLEGTPVCEVHAWLRERFPQAKEFLDLMESGAVIPRNAPFGQFTVTPGEEIYELPIIARLKERMHAAHAANG